MKKAWLFIGALLVSALVPAQEADPYAKSRAIIEDLSRIVAPTGVQDSYKTKIGGVEQWLNVRGQGRDNPMILFVHGGPAAPVTPTVWQFQRPIEEYFTVANWDQRASGKSSMARPIRSWWRTRSASSATSRMRSRWPST